MIQICRGIWSGPVRFIRRVPLLGKFYWVSNDRPCLVWDPNQPGAVCEALAQGDGGSKKK